MTLREVKALRRGDLVRKDHWSPGIVGRVVGPDMYGPRSRTCRVIVEPTDSASRLVIGSSTIIARGNRESWERVSPATASSPNTISQGASI